MEPPDPRKSLYLFASGKKGTGKSYWCRAWFDSYPLDRVLIDPTGDARQDLDRDHVEYTLIDPAVIPVSFPRGDDGEPVTLVYVPDMGAPDAIDNMDRVVGLCLDSPDHPVLLWVDEVNAIDSETSTPPNVKRALYHGRHNALTLLGAAPRPKRINPLWINQADLVATFRLTNADDRRRIAENIGANVAEFDQLVTRECRDHAYLLYDDQDDTLFVCPPLPPRRRGADHYEPIPG